MAEVWALLALIGMFFGGGWWFGRHSVEVKLRGSVSTGAGKCRFCGVLIEGGGLDMEAHERFYCRPPKKADQ